MRAVDLIRLKRDGQPMPDDAIDAFIADYTRGDVPDYQMAALAMAVFFQGMSDRELTRWTRAMLESGARLDLYADRPELRARLVDKHSTGGVGDGISLALAPLAAAAGLRVPMISGRGLGHTGGTLDKLESIPNLTTQLSPAQITDALDQHGFVIVGQTRDLVPADRKLYALRDVTATVRCPPLIASSIMSKKLAEGLRGLLLDVKVGSGAFNADLTEARHLARLMVRIGQGMGLATTALLTDMDQPLGCAIGNALELRQALDVLRGQGPDDFTRLTLRHAAELFILAGLDDDLSAALDRAQDLLDSGAALDRFLRGVHYQGGDVNRLMQPGAPSLARAQHTHTLVADATQHGTLARFDCAQLGLIAMRLGAGRARADDRIDPAVGLVLHAKRGQPIAPGTPLVTLHSRTPADAQRLIPDLKRALHITAEPLTDAPPLILDTITSDDV